MFFLIFGVLSSQELAYLSIGNVDTDAGTLDIFITNDVEIGGFQFSLSNNLTVIGAFASDVIPDEENWTIMWLETFNTVIGFSPEGDFISPGEGDLVTIHYTDYDGGDICFGDDFDCSGNGANVLSDPDGLCIEDSEWGNCYCGSDDDDDLYVDACGVCDGPGVPDNHTSFDEDDLPETTTILDGYSCLADVDIAALSDLIEANNLVDDSTALEVGNQTWKDGRLKILMASYSPSGTDGVNTQLTTLPESFGDLDSLSSLYLAWNSLTNLPQSFSQLTSLSSLTINNNWLEELPPDIGSLANLIFLDLGYNKLISIPESICDMEKLIYLYLFNNELTALPDCMCNLSIDLNGQMDWSGQDGGLHPYFASGGNYLCENVPDCIETSIYFESTLDQFYYSVIQDAPQSCCNVEAACNYDEGAEDDITIGCEYPGDVGTEYENECDCDGNFYDCTFNQDLPDDDPTNLAACGGDLIGTGVSECIDQSYSNQVDCVNSGNLWTQIGNDCSGECDGDSVEDCAGECGGTAELDECDECGGDGLSCEPVVYLSIINVNIVEGSGSLDIFMENTVPVSGIQFEIPNITLLSGTLDEIVPDGWYIVFDMIVVIVDITGENPILPEEDGGILANVTFTDYNGGEICFGTDPLYNLVSSPEAEELISDWECYTPECETWGDMNNDGALNILDVVGLAQCILGTRNNCVCGDLNDNGVTDVLDIIVLVNLILNY